MSEPPRKTVTRQDVPTKAEELEEYVAALFQAARYFVEKHVIEREPQAEILELDAVATSYETAPPESVVVEAKSGGWGFADVFKVLGWMTYLGIKHGAFFASKEVQNRDPAFVHSKSSPFGLRCVHLGDFAQARERFESAGFPRIEDELPIALWRLSYWVERELVASLRVRSKSNPSELGAAAALEYLHLVNNGVFFTADVRQRLRELYDAYKKHPKLALGVALELAGGAYDPSATDPTNAFIRDAMWTGAHPLLHGAFYVEHRARLAILKAAIDHEDAVDQGVIPAPKLGSNLSLADIVKDLSYWVLPHSFRNGLDDLKRQPAFRRYALFWQVFLWGFGGFYLKDRTETEFQWLSTQTGVPVDDVPTALRTFDILFPTPGGWLVTPGPTSVVMVKMMPYPLLGVGAIHRRFRYNVKNYYQLGYGEHTSDDLTRWHNALIELLAH